MPNVLVIGGGGREHAIVEALIASPSKPQVLAAPGNAGIARTKSNLVEVAHVGASDIDAQIKLAEARSVDLVVAGPEAPLVAGLADALRAKGIAVLGPGREGARLEGSKTFAKQVMQEAAVPTGQFRAFESPDPAVAFAKTLGDRAVVKADGLAAGKGVVVAQDFAETESAIRTMLGGQFGEASRKIVVEELLEGEELSVIALCDGERIAVLAPSQDHKRVFENDEGPNTGGMGAYSPAPRGTPEMLDRIESTCLRPVVDLMARRGSPFVGVLYAGIMLTNDGPKVLEYNVRFGDPETQAILPRLDDDAYELFLAAATGRLDDTKVRFSSCAAVTVVLAAEGYPASPKKGDVITGLDAAEANPDVKVFHAGTTHRDGQFVTNGGRVLGVTGLGDDLESAVRTTYAAVGEISWPGMHFRRDIARRALPR